MAVLYAGHQLPPVQRSPARALVAAPQPRGYTLAGIPWPRLRPPRAPAQVIGQLVGVQPGRERRVQPQLAARVPRQLTQRRRVRVALPRDAHVHAHLRAHPTLTDAVGREQRRLRRAARTAPAARLAAGAARRLAARPCAAPLCSVRRAPRPTLPSSWGCQLRRRAGAARLGSQGSCAIALPLRPVKQGRRGQAAPGRPSARCAPRHMKC